MLSSHSRNLNRARTLRFLENVESNSKSSLSIYLPKGSSFSDIIKKVELKDVPFDMDDSINKSPTGTVLFWGEVHKCLVIPPFPIEEELIIPGYSTQTLQTLLQKELIIALILVRLGDYAVAVFKGEDLISSKVGTGLVHSRHKKGGSSQRRFERHREKQIEGFFDRICGHARERLEPHEKEVDHVIYGGERNTLLSFRKQCRFLGQFNDRTSDSLLNVRKPRKSSLKDSIEEIWSSRVTEWVED